MAPSGKEGESGARGQGRGRARREHPAAFLPGKFPIRPLALQANTLKLANESLSPEIWASSKGSSVLGPGVGPAAPGAFESPLD